MSADSPLAALLGRHSTPSRQLGLPAPDAHQLQAMLQAAIRVPDHGKLVPFRLLRIEGDARLALGTFLAARSAQRNPGNPALIDKDRERFSHAPLIITVIACPQAHAKVPQWEQLLTAGCVCMNLLHAAHAMGFGAQWLSGWAAYDPAITARLGLAPQEKIAGFIHIGTSRLDVPERERPDAASLLQDWSPHA